MRYTVILLLAGAALTASGSEVKLNDCTRYHCLDSARLLEDREPQAASTWDTQIYPESVFSATAKEIVAWYAAFSRPPQSYVPTVASAPVVAPNVPSTRTGESIAAYVKSLQGLSGYEYVPVDSHLTAVPDEVIIAGPRQ